jgi:hypothetical protein
MSSSFSKLLCGVFILSKPLDLVKKKSHGPDTKVFPASLDRGIERRGSSGFLNARVKENGKNGE